MLRQTEQIENLSVIRILGRLRPPQLWGLIVILVGIVSAVYTLGYKVSEYGNSIDLKQAQVNITNLQKKETDLEVSLQTKALRERFVSDYERYLIADYNAKQRETRENQEEADRAKGILVDQILSWWRQQRDSHTPISQRIVKGFTSGDSRLVFLNDETPESIWVLPPEIKYEVLHRAQ